MVDVVRFNDFDHQPTVKVVKLGGLWYFSVLDVVMVCCQATNMYASGIIRRIAETSDYIEVCSNMTNFQFSGQGSKSQPVARLRDVQKLLMILPGKNAKAYRTKMADVFTRFLAGDEGLVDEVRANAASSSPLNVIAREDLAAEHEDSSAKRQRMEDAEYEGVMLALAERRLNLIAGIRSLKMELIRDYSECDSISNPTLRVMERDNTCAVIQNVGSKLLEMTGTPAAITATEATPPRARNPISDIVKDITGRACSKADTQRIGKIVAAEYRSRHGEREPEKVEQFCYGATHMVNAYRLADDPWIEGVVKNAIESN